MGGSTRGHICVQAPRGGIDNWIIRARKILICLDIRTVCKNTVDAGGVIHRKIKPSDGVITPANDCHFRNIEMVKERNRISCEVIVVESGEARVRRSTFPSCAARQSIVSHSTKSQKDGLTLVESPVLSVQGSSLD